jgi:hypothetical protein
MKADVDVIRRFDRSSGSLGPLQEQKIVPVSRKAL